MNTELLDISVARQAESVRTRVENSHGILKDCFQQSVVQLAQALRPRGATAATSSRTSRPSSTSRCELRDGLVRADRGALRDFEARKDEAVGACA